MACCFVFMMALIDDLYATLGLCQVLYSVPTKAQSWITYEEPGWAEDKKHAKAVHRYNEIDLVVFRVAGMPLSWKVINFVSVFVPKCLIWASLVLGGIHYLMETAGIMNTVINAMALNFVLQIDEMLFDRLTTIMTKHIMANMQEYELYSTEEEDNEGGHAVLRRFDTEELGSSRWSKMSVILSKRLILIIAMQMVCTYIYYLRNCDQEADGSWVSNDLSLPEVRELVYRPLQLMFGFELA